MAVTATGTGEFGGRPAHGRGRIYDSISQTVGDTPLVRLDRLAREKGVKANILAGKAEAEGVFNIACGKRISLNELAGRIMEIAGQQVEPVYDKPRAGDIKDSLADITAAREALGYYPDYDMNLGLKETIKWFQNL